MGFQHCSHNESNQIWVFWFDNYSVEIIHNHMQFIHLKVRHNSRNNSFYTSSSNNSFKGTSFKCLWEALGTLAVQNQPWMIAGDFNAITNLQEQRGCSTTDIEAMDDFNSFLLDCGLEDAGFVGTRFTRSDGKNMR